TAHIERLQYEGNEQEELQWANSHIFFVAENHPVRRKKCSNILKNGSPGSRTSTRRVTLRTPDIHWRLPAKASAVSGKLLMTARTRKPKTSSAATSSSRRPIWLTLLSSRRVVRSWKSGVR